MRLRSRWIFYVSLIFVVFACVTVILQIFDERSWKTAVLQSKLEGYAEVVSRLDDYSDVRDMLPHNVRVTVLDITGSVVYDSAEDDLTCENHLHRPEIALCVEEGEGYSIRESETAGKKYFYYAKKIDDLIIRTAQQYEVDLERFFRPDWVLLMAIFLLFVMALLFVITISRQYERKEIAKAEAETKRLKHEMTGNISHELKTPVSSIMGYLETIITHPELPEERKQLFLERSYHQTIRLSDMIRDISLITKLEESPEQFKITPVNLRNLVNDIIEEMRQPITDSNITVNNQLPPVCIKANEGLLYAIFRNLMENSVKYAGSGCNIEIHYEKAGNGTHLFKYWDNGRGVPAKELKKIFVRFYRLNMDRNNDGSGLGLSIVRNAVLFHQGDIEAFVPQGGGLGFKFTINSSRLSAMQ